MAQWEWVQINSVVANPQLSLASNQQEQSIFFQPTNIHKKPLFYFFTHDARQFSTRRSWWHCEETGRFQWGSVRHTRKPKVQIKRQRMSLGWAYRIYIDGALWGPA